MLAPLLPALFAAALPAQESSGADAPQLDWLHELSVNVYGNATVTRDSNLSFDDDGDPIDDRVLLRKIDLDIEGRINDRARAVVILSYDQVEDNESSSDIEEGYVELEDVWLSEDSDWELNLRFGRFRSRIGRNNRDRIFEMPQPTRPYTVQNFLGRDGFRQSGISIEALHPTGKQHDVTWTMEFINSGDIPVAEIDDGQALSVAGNVDWRWDLADDQRFLTGLSGYNGPKQSPRSSLVVYDVLYQSGLSSAESNAFSIGGEAFHARVDRKGESHRTPFGFYVFGNMQVSQRWYLGARYDRFDDIDTGTLTTDVAGIYGTYAWDKNVRFALGWEHGTSDDLSLDDSDTLLFEVNFAMGSNPVVPGWLGL